MEKLFILKYRDNYEKKYSENSWKTNTTTKTIIKDYWNAQIIWMRKRGGGTGGDIATRCCVAVENRWPTCPTNRPNPKLRNDRCFTNSSNRLDEYINCLVVTQQRLADEITRSLTFYRRALLYCTLPMQTQQHGSWIGRLIKFARQIVRLKVSKQIFRIIWIPFQMFPSKNANRYIFFYTRVLVLHNANKRHFLCQVFL